MLRIALLLVCGLASAETRYYLVEGTIELPGGKRVGTIASLAKRTTDRDAGQIEELVLSLRGSEPAQEFTTVIRPEGEKATMKSPGAFEGEAHLSGPAWQWTRMTFTARMERGGTVDGEDEFSEDRMSAVKKVMGADGRLQVIIRESGKSISQPLYDLLRARLLPAAIAKP